MEEMNPEMKKIGKHDEYLSMLDGVRVHTAKLALEMLKDNKQLQLLEPRHRPPNSPDLNPVDFGSWGLLDRNV